jgi:RNA polymerase sigma factor (sigma-70 family)
MEATDEQLMLAYRDGDAAAFDRLYERHKGRLFRYVLRGVKSRALAEELYQEIWIRVVEARARYAPTARFTTWLFTVAHNRLVDHWRKKELAIVPAVDTADEALHAGADEAADPARRVEDRQSLARFAAALEALPHAQREAFLLHEEGGLTAPEIAAATGSDPEAVKSRLRYAWQKLRQATDG